MACRPGSTRPTQQHAEDLILVAATHTSPEKLRTMAESLVTQRRPDPGGDPGAAGCPAGGRGMLGRGPGGV